MQIGTFWRGEMLPLAPAKADGSKPAAPATAQSIADGSAAIDELLLSPEAEELLALPKMSDHSATAIRGPGRNGLLPELELPKGNLQERQSEFQARLTEQLARRGIDRQQEIRLTIAVDGQAIVSNNHPHKAEIEEVFREQPELRNELAGISAQASLQRAAREAAEFQQSYRKDPLQAIRDFSHLFTRSSPPQHYLSLTGGEAASIFV